MSKNSGDGIWENILLVVVFGALAVFGYRKLKPVVENWLVDHGVDLGGLVDRAGSTPLELFVDIAAAVLGLTLLVALWRAWRRIRGRGKDNGKKKTNAWR